VDWTLAQPPSALRSVTVARKRVEDRLWVHLSTSSGGDSWRVEASKEEVLEVLRQGGFVDLKTVTGATITINANLVTQVQDDR
jgi:hypothetical protein